MHLNERIKRRKSKTWAQRERTVLNNSGKRPRLKNLQQRWCLLNVRLIQVAYKSYKRAGRGHLKFAIIFYHYACSPASCLSISFIRY